jgi:hypothetical protein
MRDSFHYKDQSFDDVYGSNAHQAHCITRNTHYKNTELCNVTASGLLKVTGKLRWTQNYILFCVPPSEPSCLQRNSLYLNVTVGTV